MKVMICDRWTIELGEPGSEPWFLDWVLRSPREAGHHLTAGWLATAALRQIYGRSEIQSCVEFFGGIGAQALMVERLFYVQSHLVMDYNEDSVRHLKSLGLKSRQQDAYKDETAYIADLFMMDFGDLTVWKTREGQPHRALLDKVFFAEPKAVVFTDIACRYLHLHRERYETLLGEGSCGTYEDYLAAFLRRLGELYGYHLLVGYYDRWSAVMTLVPSTEPETWGLIPTPSSPVGLTIL